MTPAEQYRALLEGSLEGEALQAVEAALNDAESPLSKYVETLEVDGVERDLHMASRAVPEVDSGALFRRIESQVEAPPRPFGGFDLRSLFAGLGIGAAAVAAGVLVVVPPDSASQREKGGPAPVVPELQLVFHVARPQPDRPLVIERGVPGATYSAETDVLLHFRIGKPGHVCLVHRAPGGASEPLGQSGEVLPAGEHELRVNGKVQGVRLGPTPGRHAFFAVWSEGPMECPAVLEAVQTRRTAKLLVDSVELEVKP